MSKNKVSGRFGVVSLFTVAHLFNDTYPNLYPVLIPTLMKLMHFGIGQAGLITAVAALTTSLLQPFMGLWADRVGGNWFVSGGLVAGSLLMTAALGLAPDYYLLVLLILLGGIGNSSFHPHASSLVGQTTGGRKGLGMAFFLIGGNLGRGLAPLLATYAFLWLGRPGLLVLALPGLLLALLLSRYAGQVSLATAGAQERIWQPLKENLGRLTALLGVVGLRGLTASAMVTFLPILWHVRHGPITQTAFLLSIMLLVGSLGNLLGGHLSDLLGPRPVLVGSAVLSSLLLGLFLRSEGPWIWVTMALLGAALFSTASVTMVLGQEIFPRHKAMASGLSLGVGNTLGALGVGLVGFLADYFGLKPIMDLLVLFPLLSIPFVFSLPGRLSTPS